MFRSIGLCLVLSLGLAGCKHSENERLDQPDLTAVLSSAGFSPLALASTGFGPGSLVTSRRGHGFSEPLVLAYICNPENTTPVTRQVDRASSSAMSRRLEAGVTYSAGKLAQLGLGADADYVSAVRLTFSNVRIVQVSHEELRRIVTNLGPWCRQSLDHFLEQGIARQTFRALQADVEYELEFEAGASAAVRNRILRRLLGEFDGNIGRAGDNRLVGTGLFYGVDLDVVPAG